MTIVDLPSAVELWDASRSANQYVGVFVVTFLVRRLIPLLFQLRDPRARHRMAWFVYIALSIANATAAAWNSTGPDAPPATWTSGTRFLLNLIAIGLCIWWPHPRLADTDPTVERGAP